MLHLCPMPNSNAASHAAHSQRPRPLGPLVLRIDGIGSFQILTDPLITIGSVHARPAPKLGLMISPDIPTVRIERSDEDYVLYPANGLAINGQPVAPRLLSEGDRIELSKRVRLKFHRPNVASVTAVLRVGGARLMHGDVRQVVLMDRELLIDRRVTGHIRSTLVQSPITLLRSGEGLSCGCNVLAGDGEVVRSGEPFPLDRSLEIGHVRFTLSRSPSDG